MQNNVTQQLMEFFHFVIIGILLALIFDFFRAYRKYKKLPSKKMVIWQDILYFLIATIIITFSIIYLLDSNIRFYIFLAIFLGVMAYIALFSKYFLKIYHVILSVFFETITIVLLPIQFHFAILIVIYHFFEKYMKKCCKMFFNMITYIGKKTKVKKPKKINSNKRGLFGMKRKEKKNQKKVGKAKLSILIPLIFIGYCGYTLFEQQVQINKYDSQIKLYQTEIEERNELIDYYNNQKNNVHSDEYIEKVARETLGLVKPYEKIFIDANK